MRTGGYYDASGARALPGATNSNSGFVLASDVACAAVSTTSIGNIGGLFKEDGNYLWQLDGALYVIVGATAPATVNFTIGNLPVNTGSGLVNQPIPPPLLVASAVIMFPLSLLLELRGMQNSQTLTQNATLQAILTGASGTITVKANSSVNFYAVREQD